MRFYKAVYNAANIEGREMKFAIDVKYDETASTGLAAGVVFEEWTDAQPLRTYRHTVSGIEEYVPGQFYRRELPCVLALLETVQEPLDLIVVDSYVNLADKPGMGMHLWNALDGMAKVVGVAKTQFHQADAVEVLRGGSTRPLFVTAAGMDAAEAAAAIATMHGPHRTPTLLKLADSLTRRPG